MDPLQTNCPQTNGALGLLDRALTVLHHYIGKNASCTDIDSTCLGSLSNKTIT